MPEFEELYNTDENSAILFNWLDAHDPPIQATAETLLVAYTYCKSLLTPKEKQEDPEVIRKRAEIAARKAQLEKENDRTVNIIQSRRSHRDIDAQADRERTEKETAVRKKLEAMKKKLQSIEPRPETIYFETGPFAGRPNYAATESVLKAWRQRTGKND